MLLYQCIDLLKIFIPIMAFVFTIYKYKKEISHKTAIQDFEQISKYFSGGGLDTLKKHSTLAKDAACETVSFFKGNKFIEIESLLEGDIHLDELRKIISLKKSRIILFDSKSAKMQISPDYKKKILVGWTKNAKWYERVCWFFLIIYVMVLVFVSVKFSWTEDWLGIMSLVLLVGMWEIPMLLKIEKRKQVEWFEYEKKQNLSEGLFKKFLSS
ncbi:hypothetical protein [Neisseria wadsworthii]|uniref:Uncharacterized protein n=1 Tax=Neisseria wadsworthii 9715 TaxID=1030841 RepID=G4CLR4_9NEIS|nr:hypothetical protein [Neisseria wadsworthii]EGZ51272.1 hypothetical protein HMPREF9370_0023 [Neisseria wadsworthii 9715]QMT36110.1 hypothetical protein H3L96_02365 [Neisseria wadsworthii]